MPFSRLAKVPIVPLITEGIISKTQKLVCHSITGYSGGGKELIDLYEDPKNFDKVNVKEF